MEKTLKIVIKTSSSYGGYQKVASAIEGNLPVTAISIGKKPLMGTLWLYVGKEEDGLKLGSLFKCEDENGKDMKDDPTFLAAVTAGKVKTRALSFDDTKRKIFAEASYEFEDAVSDNAASGITKTISDAIDAKSDIMSKEEAEERVNYMLANYFSEDDILDVIKHWHHVQGACKHKTLYVDPSLKKSHENKENGVVLSGVMSALCGYPVMLQGPKATGKNTYVTTVAWLLNEPLHYHTAGLGDTKRSYMSSEKTDNTAAEKVEKMDPADLANCEVIRAKHASNPMLPYTDKEKEALISEAVFKKLQAQCASVRIVHEYKAYARWILYGGIFFLDEFNFANANLIGELFHGILDHSMSNWEIPGVGLVPLSQNTMMFAAMNPGYAGSQKLNAATMSRFDALELGQPESIIDLLKAAVSHELSSMGKPDLPEVYYEQAAAFYNNVRSAATGNGLPGNSGRVLISDACLNIRGLVRALTKVGVFGPQRTKLHQQIENSVVTVCDARERYIIKKALDETVPE